MKKTISVVLALMMVFSMFATASAAPATLKDLVNGFLTMPTDPDDPVLSFPDLTITIEGKRSGTSDAYGGSPLYLIDANLASGIGADFQTTLDMDDIETFLGGRDFIDTILYGHSDAEAEFYRGKIATGIVVTITYPNAIVTDPNAGSLVSYNDGTFEYVGRTPIAPNCVEIEFKNRDSLTVNELLANKATYLEDLTFKLENAVKYATEGTHPITVGMEAVTKVTFDNNTLSDDTDDWYVTVDYNGEATYNVIADTPSSGGGSSYNTIKFDTNGGNELNNINIKRGTKVSEIPTPVRDGYVFTGWYVDRALTTPFDADTVINRNYTLYAAWVEDNGVAGSGHETPESLNGEDHFAYVVGYPDGTVRPNDNITRAEVTSIFFRLLKESVRNENLTSDNSFNDVNDEDWYNTAISTMAKLGIVKGRTADEFVPNAFITRAEFAAICARFDDSAFEMVDDFADVEGHWAEAEIHEAAAHGWIRGYEDGTFRPDRFITRAEAMTMINRVLNRVPETVNDLLNNMQKWPDNSDESVWYYLPVQEATNSHDYDMKNRIYEKWTAFDEAFDWTKYE